MPGRHEYRPATARRRSQRHSNGAIVVNDRPRFHGTQPVQIYLPAKQLLSQSDGRQRLDDPQVARDARMPGMEDSSAVDQQHGGQTIGRPNLG